MEYYVGGRDLNIMPYRKLNLIDDSILIYLYILNLPEKIGMTKKENYLEAVIGGVDSGSLRENK